MEYHRPVLLSESIHWLDVKPEGVYIDLTFGGGGHSQKILEKLGQNGKLIAFDRDEDVWGSAPDDSRFTLIPANYRHLKRYLTFLEHGPVLGVLADLGVSSHQLDEGERGFSYRADAFLDMRMGRQSGKTAAAILNTYEEYELSKVFRVYGELRQARRIAQAIVNKRKSNPLETTGDLTNILQPMAGKAEWKFYSQVFQAIRIEVNGELDAIKEMLEGALEVLAPGGRLVVISYHSLEDRLIKWFMRSGSLDGEVVKDEFGHVLTPWELPVKKPIEPGKNEIEDNPRARSARMRVAIKR